MVWLLCEAIDYEGNNNNNMQAIDCIVHIFVFEDNRLYARFQNLELLLSEAIGIGIDRHKLIAP